MRLIVNINEIQNDNLRTEDSFLQFNIYTLNRNEYKINST